MHLPNRNREISDVGVLKVFELLDKKDAIFYVCGDGKYMAKDVIQAVEQLGDEIFLLRRHGLVFRVGGGRVLTPAMWGARHDLRGEDAAILTAPLRQPAPSAWENRGL